MGITCPQCRWDEMDKLPHQDRAGQEENRQRGEVQGAHRVGLVEIKVGF